MSPSAQKVRPVAALPAERFWQELHHAPARRKSPRVHANVSVCLGQGKGPSVQTRTNDLSYHGMQVCCDKATAAMLQPKSNGKDAHPTYPVTLELDIEGMALRVNAHARVAHVTLLSGEPAQTEVAIGMTFVGFEDGAKMALNRFIEQHMRPARWP